ncbi:class I SAM-dependent methyltransferase [Pelagicoccus mobilis]|uniref:Methyltransferase domain-containing protein n=1 Tax=Pelagicoccus mobilis TaxID=415221 RepID=A0A934VRH6_9BACT|nr:class I SAM-dependent methyltransferase [Pelagicoccus mobilis]MBK1877955.1 methyltransferase domain-containing protein [Pelagicoccus mobilis]
MTVITEKLEAGSQSALLENPGNTKSVCPNCESAKMEPFYEVKGIPVHSVLLMPTRDHAANYPKGDLKLGFCPCCGFVSNMVFDPKVHEYSTSCEESQGFSPTFSSFARKLARRWVEDYDLHGKTVLEIGCGKGEFLAMMVEEGAGEGIGMDPAFVPERLDTPVSSHLAFIQDLYDERYTHLSADAICCRHTLEHISPTSSFMRMVRKTIGDRPDTVLLFELPDVYRVLKEAAFWDIYYEHCSYFTTGSLARLFRKHGFDPLELELEYDDQYIVIAGRPNSGKPSPKLAGEDDLESVRLEMRRFAERFRIQKESWLGRLNELRADGKRTVLWGGGSKAVSFLTTLGLTEQIDFVVDINPHKHGKFVPGTGHAVKSPEALRTEKPDCVVLMNPIYLKEVGAQLSGMGLSPDIIPV